MSDRIQRRRRRILAGVVVAVAVVIVGRILIGIDDWSRDWSTNYAEAGPVTSNRVPTEVTDRICAWVEEQPQWSLQSADRSLSSEHHLKLTRKTMIMNFTDDVTVKITEAGTGSSVFASSQSRIGKGDLGQNPRNLKELLSAIQ